jgi:AbrB family looped-hinge helix DNA binding protein
MTAVVGEKGQITIPKALRDQLGWAPGTVLEFAAEAGRLVARKKLVQDSFARWRGKGRLPAGKSTDEYLARIRG